MVIKGFFRYSRRFIFLLFVPVLLAVIATGRVQISQDKSRWTEIPAVETIEEHLLLKLNEARKASGLNPVRLSPDLVRLARIQSREMAELGTLTHFSATGKSLGERLNEAGILYRTSGENVARSESFLPDLINESFMTSLEHRENALKPEFDEVGIGVVLSFDRGYFITMDFVASLTLKSLDEVRSFLLGRLNEFRRRESAPDLVLIPEANEIAASFSRSRSAGRKVEADPAVLGKATVVFASGPDLDGIAETLTARVPASAPAGGLGSWSGRTVEFPGGIYHVCVILLHENPSHELRTSQMTAVVLEAADGVRRDRSLKPLVTDSKLSETARGYLGRAVPKGAPLGAWAAVYETTDLEALPDAVRSRIENKTYGRIGLAVVRSREKGLVVTYVVAILLDEVPPPFAPDIDPQLSAGG